MFHRQLLLTHAPRSRPIAQPLAALGLILTVTWPRAVTCTQLHAVRRPAAPHDLGRLRAASTPHDGELAATATPTPSTAVTANAINTTLKLRLRIFHLHC
jgi:hypothetical protein